MKLNELNDKTIDLIPFKKDVNEMTYCSDTHLAIWHKDKDGCGYLKNIIRQTNTEIKRNIGIEVSYLHKDNINIKMYNIIDSDISGIKTLIEVLFLSDHGHHSLFKSKEEEKDEYDRFGVELINFYKDKNDDVFFKPSGMKISYKDILKSIEKNNGWLFIIYNNCESEIHLNLIGEKNNVFPFMNIPLKDAAKDKDHKIIVFD